MVEHSLKVDNGL